jgi:hypothetical protein
VFEKSVLRQIFECQIQKVTGNWSILHNKGLNDLTALTKYCSSDQTKRLSSTGHGARMGDRRYVYSVIIGKPEGKTTGKT